MLPNILKIFNFYVQDKIEWALGIHAIVWGIQILSPYSDIYSTLNTYRFLNTWFPDFVVGGVAIVLGFFILYFAALKDKIGRATFAMLLLTFWFIIFTSFLFASPTGTGWPTYGLICLITVRLYVKVGSL